MLLMRYSVKCTRRHAGGNCSISVRMAALKPLGSEFSPDQRVINRSGTAYLRLRSQIDCGGFLIFKGVIYCLSS